MPRKASKKQRHDDESDDEDDRVLFWIPSADISIDVLVFYLQSFLGHDSDAFPGNNPRDPDQDGYFIKSRFGLSTAMVLDIKRDSIAWRKEKRGKRRITYPESETAETRKDAGASAQPLPLTKSSNQGDTRRAVVPAAQGAGQGAGATQKSNDRHQTGDTSMSNNPISPSPSPAWPQSTSSQNQPQRHQPYPQGNQYGMNVPAVSVHVSQASYAQSASQRHVSPAGQPSGAIPSIESRYNFLPAYEEEEGKSGGSNPSVSGSHGFSNYSTAGSRHDKR